MPTLLHVDLVFNCLTIPYLSFLRSTFCSSFPLKGEYAGLLCIRAYHASRGDSHRNVCLIPVSAHGKIAVLYRCYIMTVAGCGVQICPSLSSPPPLSSFLFLFLFIFPCMRELKMMMLTWISTKYGDSARDTCSPLATSLPIITVLTSIVTFGKCLFIFWWDRSPFGSR